MLEENIFCWIGQLERGEAAAMSPGPTSSEAERVFPIGRCAQSTRIHHIYTYTHTGRAVYVYLYLHTEHRHAERSMTKSIKAVNPLLSLAEQDGGPLARERAKDPGLIHGGELEKNLIDKTGCTDQA